jgi:signal transduction histidine kinase
MGERSEGTGAPDNRNYPMTAPRVLLVEDERIVAMDLQRRLRRLGYDVPAIVTSGEDALQAITLPELSPDVVLMDIHIQGELDGIQTAARIPPELGLPVIYLSAYSDEATLERARSTRPYGYLVKPFSERELRATIEMVLEQARAAAADRALREAQKMEAIGHVSGSIGHEFNNLLTVLRGSLELIRDAPLKVERVVRLADKALVAVDRGERLTRQLLMFSRRQALFPEAVDLAHLLTEFKPALEATVSRDTDLVLQLDPELDRALVDPAQFHSAILNLVMNAREAIGDKQGKITIEAKKVQLEPSGLASAPELKPGSYMLIAVSDDGCGIAVDKLQRAFEPFFTTKVPGEGRGLGLSQVQGFARESGGHVEIESKPNQGTTVRLYLPQAPHEPAGQSAPELSDAIPKGATVLVVDDNGEVLDIAIETLSGAGWNVLTACDAAEALAVLRSGIPIAALFTDVLMPGEMNGAELAAAARRLHPSINILLTSGSTKAALAARGVLGMEAPFLPKPYDTRELLARLSGGATSD